MQEYVARVAYIRYVIIIPFSPSLSLGCVTLWLHFPYWPCCLSVSLLWLIPKFQALTLQSHWQTKCALFKTAFSPALCPTVTMLLGGSSPFTITRRCQTWTVPTDLHQWSAMGEFMMWIEIHCRSIKLIISCWIVFMAMTGRESYSIHRMHLTW